MINLLKPVREIIVELNQMESKWTSIVIHGVGKIQNVTYDGHYWRFTMRLNDGIHLNCSMIANTSENYLYFEEGDKIEFFGRIHTYWQGLSPRYNVSDICLDEVKLSNEERFFSDVLMWNIKTHKGNFGENVAYTRNERIGCKESEIAYIGEIEETESKWVYGTLVETKAGIILELIKFF